MIGIINSHIWKLLIMFLMTARSTSSSLLLMLFEMSTTKYTSIGLSLQTV